MEDADTEKLQREIEKIPDDSRSTILTYLRYYALSLAKESLKCDRVEDIKFRDGGFAVIRNLSKVFSENKGKVLPKP